LTPTETWAAAPNVKRKTIATAIAVIGVIFFVLMEFEPIEALHQGPAY